MSNSEKSLHLACCFTIYQFLTIKTKRLRIILGDFPEKYGMIAIVVAEYQNTSLLYNNFATCPCPIGCPSPVPGGAIGQILV